MRALITMIIILAGSGAWAQDLADFWKPGRVRELFSSGIATTPEEIKSWADCGVNCLTGAKPAEAHAAGLKTRTWFTMNYMDSRWAKLEDIEKMAARTESGNMIRPVDPLFPTVGQYGYTACVNNPLWREHSAQVFRNQATEGYDGVHVDFASHYERCFCDHCAAAWTKAVAGTDLAAIRLAEAEKAIDFRTRMILREFRIRCVIDFLGMCREEARKIKPGYSLDGTYHHDSGSTFQWQYGDHYDLMCIEGTTAGPFPPASQQIVWLKTSAGLSRGRVPMSVTYHLLRDEEGNQYHGRMASDRLEVALAEILSQGAVSWLGLGGPKTGNLLQEHQPLVKEYYRFFADHERFLTEGRPRAEVALIFSPKSYQIDNSPYQAVYVLGEYLMKRHVPFTVLGDRDLTAGKLATYRAVVMLPAPILSDETINDVSDYARGGGKVFYLGQQGQYDDQYRERKNAPDYLATGQGEVATTKLGQGQGPGHEGRPYRT